jgi:hypothetical protein
MLLAPELKAKRPGNDPNSTDYYGAKVLPKGLVESKMCKETPWYPRTPLEHLEHLHCPSKILDHCNAQVR